MNTKEMIMVGVANEGEFSFNVEDIKLWEPKNITHSGLTVLFKHEDKFYLMKREDFKRIFEN
jgi:hypothetical protein